MTLGEKLKQQLQAKAEESLSQSSLDILEKTLQEIQHQRDVTTGKVVDEILQYGTSIECGWLIEQFVTLLDKRAPSDAERGELAVKYAALYPTFGHEGISLLVDTWHATTYLRRTELDTPQ